MEVVVRDSLEPCAYLEEQTARLPMRWQLVPLLGEGFDASLALGDRRVGKALYRPSCPGCQACEAIRIPVDEFQPSRTQRRVWRRGVERFTVELGKPLVTREHLRLFNRHKRERGLARREGGMSARAYAGWLVETCAESRELRYRVDGELAAVAIVDLGSRDASAVYTFFDPALEALSPGVFSVLWQLDWARREGLRFLYLGLYVERNRHMVYKARYRPHERLVPGPEGARWRRFER